MPKAKPYSGPLDVALASQVLNSTGAKEGEELLGDALRNAAETLEKLVRKANAEIKGNEFAIIVAEHLATKMNRRGVAHLTVSDTGKVLLHVSYEDNRPIPKTTRQRRVPLMKELKARAQALGIDISPFGIKRTKIHEHLEKMTGQLDVSMLKAKQPSPRELEKDPGPMSAGPDETTLSAPPEVLPPRKPLVKIADISPSGKTPGEKGKSMRQLVMSAKEVDIADLLASDPPR